MPLISLIDWNGSRKAAVTASITYALLLASPGVYTPFFPLWLSARGFGAQEIGILLAIPMFMRVAAAPFAWIGDGPLGPRRTFLVVMCGSAFGYAALTYAHDFLGIAVLLAVAFVLFSAATPLLDTIVLDGVALHGHKYGRIRQWGSLSWLVAGLAAGLLLKRWPVTTVPPILAILAAATAIAALFLPNDRHRSRALLTRASGGGTAPGLPLLVLFVTGIGCIQGAHAFLYGFATMIWEKQGFSSLQISELWAIGIVTETCIFLFGGNVAGWLGPYRLIAIGGVAGIARWSLFGFAPAEAWEIVALQAMHGLTFACVHLATMGWLARFTRNPSVRQGIAASAIGIGLTVATALAGWLYATFAAAGFFAMALICAGGLGLIALAAAAERQQRQAGP